MSLKQEEELLSMDTKKAKSEVSSSSTSNTNTEENNTRPFDKNADIKYHLSDKILKTILSDGSGGFYQKSEIDLEIARPITRTMFKMHRANQDNYFSNQFVLGDRQRKWIRKLTPTEAFRLQGFPIGLLKMLARWAQTLNSTDRERCYSKFEALLNSLIEQIGLTKN